jgi:hypothetical protein
MIKEKREIKKIQIYEISWFIHETLEMLERPKTIIEKFGVGPFI